MWGPSSLFFSSTSQQLLKDFLVVNVLTAFQIWSEFVLRTNYSFYFFFVNPKFRLNTNKMYVSNLTGELNSYCPMNQRRNGRWTLYFKLTRSE